MGTQEGAQLQHIGSQFLLKFYLNARITHGCASVFKTQYVHLMMMMMMMMMMIIIIIIIIIMPW